MKLEQFFKNQDSKQKIKESLIKSHILITIRSYQNQNFYMK